MKDKLTAIRVNLIMILKRVEKLVIDEQVYYEIEQKINQLNEKLYEIGDLLEEIEAVEEF